MATARYSLTISRAESIDELGFDGAGNLEMVRETLAGGRVAYEVHYSDYRDAGNGIKFPQQVGGKLSRRPATTVKFRYENPSINQDVPDSTFVLLPRSGTRRLTLGMATLTTARRTRLDARERAPSRALRSWCLRHLSR